MVIFNEKEHIKNILEEHDASKNKNIKYLIRCIIKYYYPEYQNMPTKEYVRKVLDIIETFEYDDAIYREFMYYDYIKRICKNAQNGKFNTYLREIDSVDVTEAEMEIIAKGKNDRECKLLFTLYVLAKVYSYHSGWVNYPSAEIFKLANISLKYEDRFLLIHELYKAKLIQLNHIIGKTGYKVKPTAITISINHDFGNQYLAFVRDGWKTCDNCMKLIKIKGKHQRYCRKCAEEIEAFHAVRRMRKYRKNQ